MRGFVIGVVALWSLTSVAELPSNVLPDGNYSVNCSSINVYEDLRGQIIRSTSKESGVLQVLIDGQTVHSKSRVSLIYYGQNFDSLSEEEVTTTTVYRPIAKDQFDVKMEQKSEILSSEVRGKDFKDKNMGPSTEYFSQSWVVKSTGNLVVNQFITGREGLPDRIGQGESIVNTKGDGAYQIISYTRGETPRIVYDLDTQTWAVRGKGLFSSETCDYVRK